MIEIGDEMNWKVLVCVLLMMMPLSNALAQDPSTRPSEEASPSSDATKTEVVDVADTAAVKAMMGKDVILVGTVKVSEWSRSGRVMNIEFDDGETKLLVVLFERSRESFDKAFGGDVAKALKGAKVRVTGKLEEYGGRDEKMKGRPQVILNRASQLTIVTPATSPS
jgi:DNA/RNA endonuclease YhcR with UshA esterase domain